MEDKYVKESKELHERKSKNLLWLGIISIVMLFAGLTSAYIVVKGDNFWVELKLPQAFWISTGLAILGSATINFALRAAKKSNKKRTKLFVGSTLLLGLAFTYTQYIGWGQLIESGNYLVGNIMSDGRYGAYFTIHKDGQPIEFNDGTYFLNDEPLEEKEKQSLQDFASNIAEVELPYPKLNYNIKGMEQYTIYFKDQKLQLDGKLLAYPYPGSDSLVGLSYEQRLQLQNFAENIAQNRGDFMLEGNYGEDFTVYFKGVPLKYENRKLYMGDKELTKRQYADLASSRNTASSFIYVLTFMHILHLFGGLLYVIRIFIGSLKERYDADNHLKIKLAGIYWHFLGALWIYLFLFLTFIH